LIFSESTCSGVFKTSYGFFVLGIWVNMMCLTNNHDLVSKVECFPELSISDHFPMVIETNIANNKNYSSIEEIFDYRKADFNGMHELLCTINWLK
jgi:hypothetical protein